MTYSAQDAQDAIDALNNFWSSGLGFGDSYVDLVDAMKNLVAAAAYDPTIKMIFASQGVFINGLTNEPAQDGGIQSAIQGSHGAMPTVFAQLWDANSGYGSPGGPRLYMLGALKQAILGGFWATDPDPTGLASWIGLTDAAGQAIAHTISNDPEPVVRAAALDLLKSVNWPVTWAQTLLGALGGLDDAIAGSSWSATDRASLSALSKDVRARALTAANAAQSHNFKTITGSDGSQEDITIDAPGKPWYKNGVVLSAGFLGVLGGVMTAVHRSKQRQ